jgi:hypothetical protein
MIPFLRHVRIRAVVLARSPWSLGILVVMGLISLDWWPYLMDTNAWIPKATLPKPSWWFGTNQFMWIVFWSALPGKLVGGRAAAEERWGSFRTPLPTIPIGSRSRVLAEAALAMLIIVIVRTPGLWLGDWLRTHSDFRYGSYTTVSFPIFFWKRTFIGVILTFPVILAWASPVRRIETVFRRPITIGIVLWIAMKLDLLASLAGCIAVSGALTAILLATIEIEWAIPVRWKRSAGDAASRWRPARAPEMQLLRDLFVCPLPLVAAIVWIEIPVILLDRYVFHSAGDSGPGVMAVGSALVIMALYSYLPYYPLRQIVVLRAFGAGGGTHPRAWSILPMRRESVARSIYLYSLLSAIALWGFAMGLVFLSARLHSGHGTLLALDDTHGAAFGLLCLAIPFTTAGFVAAGAAGARVRTILGVLSTFGIMTALLILISSRGLQVPATAAIVALAIIGGAPAWWLLRDSRGEVQRNARWAGDGEL